MMFFSIIHKHIINVLHSLCQILFFLHCNAFFIQCALPKVISVLPFSFFIILLLFYCNIIKRQWLYLHDVFSIIYNHIMNVLHSLCQILSLLYCNAFFIQCALPKVISVFSLPFFYHFTTFLLQYYKTAMTLST